MLCEWLLKTSILYNGARASSKFGIRWIKLTCCKSLVLVFFISLGKLYHWSPRYYMSSKLIFCLFNHYLRENCAGSQVIRWLANWPSNFRNIYTISLLRQKLSKPPLNFYVVLACPILWNKVCFSTSAGCFHYGMWRFVDTIFGDRLCNKDSLRINLLFLIIGDQLPTWQIDWRPMMQFLIISSFALSVHVNCTHSGAGG